VRRVRIATSSPRQRESHAVIAGIAGPDAQARIGTLQQIATALQPIVTAMQPPASLLVLVDRRALAQRAVRPAMLRPHCSRSKSDSQ
jgi:hypothetical protein